jgi:hypothetical protein
MADLKVALSLTFLPVNALGGKAIFEMRHTLSSQSDPRRGIGAALNWAEARFKAESATCGGSGSAAVLEAARVLSNHKFRGTIVYALLSGEEQGLCGGKLLAALAAIASAPSPAPSPAAPSVLTSRRPPKADPPQNTVLQSSPCARLDPDDRSQYPCSGNGRSGMPGFRPD